MHIVSVQVTVKEELLAEFEQAILHNARESVAREQGCLRFDVSQAVDDPAVWLYHEVYDAPESHAAHRRSEHFLMYQVVEQRAVVDKRVIKGVGKHVTSLG
jgi:(4S)-4-hydroxy-5-phosphonooxypentane-2,3-dione isomerase